MYRTKQQSILTSSNLRTANNGRSTVRTSLASHLWISHRGTTHVVGSHQHEPAATCGFYRAVTRGGGLAVFRCNIDYNTVYIGGCCSALCCFLLLQTRERVRWHTDLQQTELYLLAECPRQACGVHLLSTPGSPQERQASNASRGQPTGCCVSFSSRARIYIL